MRSDKKMCYIPLNLMEKKFNKFVEKSQILIELPENPVRLLAINLISFLNKICFEDKIQEKSIKNMRS